MVKSIGELEESIDTAISISGVTANRVGPFISGYISLEGPEFPNELFRQYNQMLSRVDSALTVSNDEHIRKQVWFLKEVGVLEEVTAEVLSLDPDAERGEFDKRFYDISHGVDMGWLKEDVQSISLALAALNECPVLNSIQNRRYEATEVRLDMFFWHEFLEILIVYPLTKPD